MANEPAQTNPHLIEDLEHIARITLALGNVERATRTPEGRPETVTTHTVMLALVCVHLHDAGILGDLNLSRLLLCALTHDLPEALCGDTDTSRPLSDEERLSKRNREKAAADDIRRHFRFVTSGSIGQHVNIMLDPRHRQRCAPSTPEALAVASLDKMMPKLVRSLGGGTHQPRELADTLEILREQMRLHSEVGLSGLAGSLTLRMLAVEAERAGDEDEDEDDAAAWVDSNPAPHAPHGPL